MCLTYLHDLRCPNMAVKNAEDDDNLDENEEQEEKENVGSPSVDIACLL